jgi:excisionase family DNA binding protein
MSRAASPDGANRRTRTAAALGDLAALPPVLDVESAARLLGIGRTTAYRLAEANALPVPVVRIGRVLRIPTVPLLAVLGIALPDLPAASADRACTDTQTQRGAGRGAQEETPAQDRDPSPEAWTRSDPASVHGANPRPADSPGSDQTITTPGDRPRGRYRFRKP